MYEIRFHGRGGQGAVLAIQILAKALVHEGKFIKGVPSFGFERRGAPVTSYLRFDDKEIRQTTNIYNPDWIVFFINNSRRSGASSLRFSVIYWGSLNLSSSSG